MPFLLRKLNAPRELDPAFLIASFLLPIRILRYKTQNYDILSLADPNAQIQNSELSIILSPADPNPQIQNSEFSNVLSLADPNPQIENSDFFQHPFSWADPNTQINS